MRTLKKVICLIGILLFSLSSYTYAQMVQISDTGAYQLFTTINQINQVNDLGFPVKDFHHIGMLSENSPYDIYMCAVGSYGHVAIISFYCNKAGFVSKITTMCVFDDEEAMAASAKSMALLSSGLGLSTDECNVLIAKERLVAQRHSDVWGAKINRRIVLELIPDLSHNLFISRLTAYDT